MTPRLLLRLEGGLVLLAAITAYAAVGASWGLFAALLLAPDVFMAGYLAGPVVGARLYNAGHTYAVPLALGAAAYGLGIGLLGSVALIWTAHIGMDRALGYGLKHARGFHHTHLSAPSEERADGTRVAARRTRAARAIRRPPVVAGESRGERP
jgi:hypothetical protein